MILFTFLQMLTIVRLKTNIVLDVSTLTNVKEIVHVYNAKYVQYSILISTHIFALKRKLPINVKQHQ